MKTLVLIGMGGHAKSVIDSIHKTQQYHIAGYVDICDKGDYNGYNYIGSDKELETIYKTGVTHAVISLGYLGGIENSIKRRNLFKYLKQIGFVLPPIVDPSAILADNVYIGEGVYIGKNAVINADVRIGEECIINTNVVVEHECKIGGFSHVAANATLCGNIIVEEDCFIGAGAQIIQGLKINKGSIVGAGATVIKDVPQMCTVVGVPARILKRK